MTSAVAMARDTRVRVSTSAPAGSMRLASTSPTRKGLSAMKTGRRTTLTAANAMSHQTVRMSMLNRKPRQPPANTTLSAYRLLYRTGGIVESGEVARGDRRARAGRRGLPDGAPRAARRSAAPAGLRRGPLPQHGHGVPGDDPPLSSE